MNIRSENKDEYQKYLERIHNKKSTSDQVIYELVNEATGSIPISKTKLMTGEVNEVYDIMLPNMESIIVRIHTDVKPVFLQEKWAIEQCREKGIPVPTILLIKHIDGGDSIVSICIQEKLKGDTLERGKVNFWDLDRNLLRTLMLESGELLARMHTIYVEGFGNLDKEGKGKYKTFRGMMLEKPKHVGEYIKLAKNQGIPERDMNFALKTITKNERRFENVKPVFNHGDFAPKHIMYEGEVITGILDFGDVLGHSPVFDFARWEYWYGPSIAFDWLREGYSDKSIFTEDYQELSRLIQLDMSLGTISWYGKEKYNKGIKHGVDRMNEMLKFYK